MIIEIWFDARLRQCEQFHRKYASCSLQTMLCTRARLRLSMKPSHGLKRPSIHTSPAQAKHEIAQKCGFIFFANQTARKMTGPSAEIILHLRGNKTAKRNNKHRHPIAYKSFGTRIDAIFYLLRLSSADQSLGSNQPDVGGQGKTKKKPSWSLEQSTSKPLGNGWPSHR